MQISLKAVLVVAAILGVALIALIVLESRQRDVGAVVEIEGLIAGLMVTTAVGALYVGEKLGTK